MIRDRIKELRRVPASELRANPRNWRRHPPSQTNALRGILNDIGFADAVICRETSEGLELIDGHLRQEVMGDQKVPVLIVDVTAEEADKLLVTLDPLAMMAQNDQDRLLEVLTTINFEDKAVDDMLEALVNGERMPLPDWSYQEGPSDVDIINRAAELGEHYAEKGTGHLSEMLDLVCPSCGEEFSIQRQELLKDYPNTDS